MQNLACRACGAPLQSSDLDRRLAIISCASCGAIFDLARRRDRDQGPTAMREEPSPERAPVALPDRFKVERGGRTLKVSWRWFQAPKLFFIPFAIGWNAFLVNWYAMALGDSVQGSGMDWIMVVFPLGHVVAGVVVSWVAVTNLINSSRVVVSAGTLRVRHGPLPWWPMPTIRARDIEQLYCTRKVTRGKNGATVTFELRAVTREHAGRKLLGGLTELDQALWLEQEIEQLLDIRDRPVAGEHKGDGARV